MISLRPLLFLLVLFFSVSGQANAQCSLREVPLADRIKRSGLVVEGRVVEQHSYWDSGHNHIYTSSKLEVYKVFKGGPLPATLHILTVGGIVGNEMETTSSLLSLNLDDVGTFACVEAGEPGIFQVYSGRQGFIRYNPADGTAAEPFHVYKSVREELYTAITKISGEEMRVIREPEPARVSDHRYSAAFISGFTPSLVSGGFGDTVTITGSGFGLLRDTGYVAFRNADDGGKTLIKPLASQYVLWTDNAIRVEVPFKAGSGKLVVQPGGGGSVSSSLSALTVPYTRINLVSSAGKAVPANHISQSGNGGYVWQMNQRFHDYKAANASFMRAFNGWKCQSFINWSEGPVTSLDSTKRDNRNVIRFDNGSELPDGVLGVCFSYFNGCPDNSSWYVSEFDIVFDDGLIPSSQSSQGWQFGPSTPSGNQIDFESVALHELGHGMQLGHVNKSSDLMNYALAFGEVKRTITPEDLQGALRIMARNKTRLSCGPDLMVPLSAGNCADTVIVYVEKILVSFTRPRDENAYVLKYSLPSDSRVLVDLYDVMGRKVQAYVRETQTVGVYTIRIEDNLELPPGLYIASLVINEGSYNFKLLKKAND